MGFMGLSCICDSDNASDAAGAIMDEVAAMLEKEALEKANSINTPGYINVALFYQEILLPSGSQYVKGNERLQKLAVKILPEVKRMRLSFDGDLKLQAARLEKGLEKFIAEGKKYRF